MDDFNPFECPICLMVFDKKECIPTSFPCGHSTCISHCSGLTECPICRKAMPNHKTLNANYCLRDGSELYSKLMGDIEQLKLSMSKVESKASPLIDFLSATPAQNSIEIQDMKVGGDIVSLPPDKASSNSVRPPPPPASATTTTSATVFPGGMNPMTEWTCEICTLLNDTSNSKCSLCDSPRPSTGGLEWICQACTMVNSVFVDKCDVCNSPQTTSNGLSNGNSSGKPPPPKGPKPFSSSSSTEKYQCQHCMAFFDSRNKLFEHLAKQPSHANTQIDSSSTSGGHSKKVLEEIKSVATSLATATAHSDSNSNGILNAGLNIYDVANALIICETLKLDIASSLEFVIAEAQMRCATRGFRVPLESNNVMLSSMAQFLAPSKALVDKSSSSNPKNNSYGNSSSSTSYSHSYPAYRAAPTTGGGGPCSRTITSSSSSSSSSKGGLSLLKPAETQPPVFSLGGTVRSMISKFDRGQYSPGSKQPNAHMKSCGHSCCLSSALPRCCWCADVRPKGTMVDKYVDGHGWIEGVGNREDGYCITCKTAKDRGGI